MSKLWHRILALFVAASICPGSITFATVETAETASLYMDAISDAMDTLRKNDSSASDTNHQFLNGRYRTVQMLEIIAYELDSTGKYAEFISGVMDTLRRNDSRASNINYQILNGAYRTV